MSLALTSIASQRFYDARSGNRPADGQYRAPFLAQLMMAQVQGLDKNPLDASEIYGARQFQVSNDPVLFDRVV